MDRHDLWQQFQTFYIDHLLSGCDLGKQLHTYLFAFQIDCLLSEAFFVVIFFSTLIMKNFRKSSLYCCGPGPVTINNSMPSNFSILIMEIDVDLFNQFSVIFQGQTLFC